MNHAIKYSILLLILLIVTTPVVFANSHAEEHESEGLELSVISGLFTFILVVATVVAGRLMRKGKVAMKTHHTFAYITVISALFHGIYNLLTH